MRRKQKRKNQPLKKKTKTNRCPYSQVKKGYEEDVMRVMRKICQMLELSSKVTTEN